MAHYPGQIAEYGTTEFENNQSVFTPLEKGKWTNPHGIIRDITLYHRSEGYKLAGSCATWTNENWGVQVYYEDGTTGGRAYKTLDEAREYWNILVNAKAE